MPYIEEPHEADWETCPHAHQPLSVFVEDMKRSADKTAFLDRSWNQGRFDAAMAIAPENVRQDVRNHINGYYLHRGYDAQSLDSDTLAWYRLMGWIERGSRNPETVVVHGAQVRISGE